MPDDPKKEITRRQFLERSFAFSAASLLAGCGTGINATAGKVDPVTGGISHFLMVGDWGEDGTPNDQASVAFGMKSYVQTHGFTPDGLLLLGDNFYGNLKGGSASSRFITQFEAMYPEDIFDCPALAIPGNHDYQVAPVSKYQAELQYALDNTTRWTMPAQSYRISLPATNPLVTFLCLDSNMPNEPAQPPPSGNYYVMSDAQRLAQIEWLEAELALPTTTPFTVVLGHHPLYSNGQHGDNQTLIRDWGPLFQQYNVPLYIAGHDHDMQHIEISGLATSFFMSGGGGATLYPIPPKKHSGYIQEIHGFSHLQVTETEMILRHLDPNGALLHKFTRTLDGTVTIQH
ncbi:MAG: metallophosphoesterase [Acidobacteriaceae bacterium]|nr:metallophosphoesterase [Acidobacteriaceae bacterium]